MVRALHAGTHVELGFGAFYEYAERLFGYGPRLTQEKIRMAEALAELPETAEALKAGNISFSAARELTRVAIPATERQWLEAAQGRTVREVEELVSGHRPGSLPDDVPDAGAKRHVFRLEVSGAVLATFREAMAKLRRDAGEALDDDAALLLLSRHVLAGQRDEGRSAYQIALTVCERCRRGTQKGRGELIEVSPEVVAMAECDGQHIGPVHVGADEQPPCAKRTIGTHVGEQTTPVKQSAHHAAIHAGKLLLEGTPGGSLTFFHADGTVYGQPVSASSVAVRMKAYRALVELGFRESQTKRALAHVPLYPDMNVERLVRQSLRELAAGRH